MFSALSQLRRRWKEGAAETRHLIQLQEQRIVALEESVRNLEELREGLQRVDLENQARIAQLERQCNENERRVATEKQSAHKLRLENEKLAALCPGITSLRDHDHEYKFIYRTAEEKRRADRLFTKEPGTISWLAKTLRPGDVFFDIGANIGVYTIFAGRLIGEAGLAYGFEPHLPNAAALLTNIEINELRSRVRVIAIPLSDQDDFEEFQYYSLNPSRSHSQLGRSALRGKPFNPVATELKYGCRLDSLLDHGFLPAPTVIKIDVDGLECEVIAGMTNLLRSPRQPRSIQVELGAETYDRIMAQMAESGYEMVERHWTQSGQERVDANPAAEFPYNAIFARPGFPPKRQDMADI
jgi:FkbM family methyltransferase